MKARNVYFPVCIFLLFLYCVLVHVPKNFLLWLIFATIGDLIFNPIIRVEES